EARNFRRAHAEQGESALVVGVNELVRSGGDLREDAQPCERINAFMNLQRARRNRGPAYAVEAIASGDEIAKQLFGFSIALKRNSRIVFKIADADGFRVENNDSTGRETRRDQIFNDLVLRVNGDALAAGETGKINAM